LPLKPKSPHCEEDPLKPTIWELVKPTILKKPSKIKRILLFPFSNTSVMLCHAVEIGILNVIEFVSYQYLHLV